MTAMLFQKDLIYIQSINRCLYVSITLHFEHKGVSITFYLNRITFEETILWISLYLNCLILLSSRVCRLLKKYVQEIQLKY